jgi:hypothetical protein
MSNNYNNNRKLLGRLRLNISEPIHPLIIPIKLICLLSLGEGNLVLYVSNVKNLIVCKNILFY